MEHATGASADADEGLDAALFLLGPVGGGGVGHGVGAEGDGGVPVEPFGAGAVDGEGEVGAVLGEVAGGAVVVGGGEGDAAAEQRPQRGQLDLDALEQAAFDLGGGQGPEDGVGAKERGVAGAR